MRKPREPRRCAWRADSGPLTESNRRRPCDRLVGHHRSRTRRARSVGIDKMFAAVTAARAKNPGMSSTQGLELNRPGADELVTSHGCCAVSEEGELEAAGGRSPVRRSEVCGRPSRRSTNSTAVTATSTEAPSPVIDRYARAGWWATRQRDVNSLRILRRGTAGASSGRARSGPGPRSKTQIDAFASRAGPAGDTSSRIADVPGTISGMATSGAGAAVAAPRCTSGECRPRSRPRVRGAPRARPGNRSQPRRAARS